MTSSIASLVKKIHSLARSHHIVFTTAESCTAGTIASILTSCAGASTVFDRGFITYTKQSKKDMLNISEEIFLNYGSVSSQMAVAMAQGALKNSQANLAIAITGNIGPQKDTHSLHYEKHGQVYICFLCSEKHPVIKQINVNVLDTRSKITRNIAKQTLQHLVKILTIS